MREKKDAFGFTLAELLVVVSVVFASAVIFMSAASRAGEDEQLALCMANMRIAGLAFGFYANDYGDYMPVDFQNHNRMNHIRFRINNQATGVSKEYFGMGHLLSGGYLDNISYAYCPSASVNVFDPDVWAGWRPGTPFEGNRAVPYTYYLGPRLSASPESGNISITSAFNRCPYSRELDTGHAVTRGGLAEITTAKFAEQGRGAIMADRVNWSEDFKTHNHGIIFNVLFIDGGVEKIALTDEEMKSAPHHLNAPVRRFAYFDYKR